MGIKNEHKGKRSKFLYFITVRCAHIVVFSSFFWLGKLY